MKYPIKFLATSVLTLAISGAFLPALAQFSPFSRDQFPWSAVGSSGVTDATDINDVVFMGSIATISPNATLPARVRLRYNIVATPGLVPHSEFVAASCVGFAANLRDNGNGGRVIVQLRRVKLSTAVTETIAIIDSNQATSPPSEVFRQHLVTFVVPRDDDGLLPGFDFANYAYYVEVELRRRNPLARPALAALWLLAPGTSQFEACPPPR
jgi:hypothetical protein